MSTCQFLKSHLMIFFFFCEIGSVFSCYPDAGDLISRADLSMRSYETCMKSRTKVRSVLCVYFWNSFCLQLSNANKRFYLADA